ncbi:hypothetical protein MN086_07350 [Sulfurovum sp. XGS-02]|uniref:lipopolysaccharide biosynthesis protein n=1 Tax=Sulfurovum sp. XGS-02 TaxID=2925411 RepID=UPI00204AA7AD|nr:hypothetical protein [Sulfurovum sp. XGS-02]UPT76869.1 hypothetical protein MN086_07350 [Sulfurovum sp. XGS-02]
MSRRKTIYTTMIFNFLLQIVNFSYKFLITPFLLSAWGNIKYGEWLVIFSFVTSLSLLNFGIAKFYGNNLRKLYLKDKVDDYKVLFSEAIILALVIFLFIGVGLFIIIENVNLIEILNITDWPKKDVQLAVFLLGLSIAGSIFLEIISYLYVSIGKYSVQPLLSSVNLLIQLCLIIILSYFNFGIVAMSVIVLGSVVTITGISLIVFIIKNPELVPNRVFFKIQNILTSIKTSSYFQLITFSQFFILQGSVLLISHQLGAATVSLFVITRTITSGLGRQIIQIVNHSIWPELTSLFAEGNYEKLRFLHLLIVKISIILVTFFSLFIFLFIDDIFCIWLSTDDYLDYNLISLLLCYLMVLYTWIPSSFVLMANNNVKYFGLLSFLSSLFFLILSYLLLPTIGLYGLIYILIISDFLFMTFFIPKFACSKINENYWKLLVKILKLFLPSIILFIVFNLYLVDRLKYYDVGEKVLFTFIISIFMMLYFIKTSMTSYEKGYVLDIFNNKYKKGNK